MHRSLPALLIIVSLGFIQSCSDQPAKPKGVDLSTPQRVLATLVKAYNTRDYRTYAKLLSQDYVFTFQKPDPAFPEGMNREQDTRSFENMCKAADRITLTMSIGEAEPLLLGEEPARRIRVGDTRLIVSLPSRGPLVMENDLQIFTFRLGKEHLGEDPNRYYLARWQDVAMDR